MEHAEIVAKLKADGFTHVGTMAGRLPIDEWLPYGNVPGGVNYSPSYSAWTGEIIGPGLVRDLPHYPDTVKAPFVLGVWEFFQAVDDDDEPTAAGETRPAEG